MVDLSKCSKGELALLTLPGCVGKMGVHFSMDSSGILKVDKAESVIEVWEQYEVEVPVDAPKEAQPAKKQNVTIEAREMLEDDEADDSQVIMFHGHGRTRVLPADGKEQQQTDWQMCLALAVIN